MAMKRSYLLFVAMLSLAQTHCVLERSATRVHVREPGGVSIAPGWATVDEAQVVVLPASAQPSDVVVAQGSFRTDGDSSASYATHATREEDGSISIRWTNVPMPSGDRQTLVGGDGIIEVRGLDAAQMIEGGVGHGQLRLRSSAWLSRTVVSPDTGADTLVGYEGHVGIAEVPRDSAVTVPLTLATPWSNVTEVRRISRPKRVLALALAGIVAGTFGGVGLGLALSSSKPVAVVGESIIGVGALIDLLLLPTIFAGGTDERVYPR